MNGRIFSLAPAVAVAVGLLVLSTTEASPQSRGKIAGFGSSVCNGSGDELAAGGTLAASAIS